MRHPLQVMTLQQEILVQKYSSKLFKKLSILQLDILVSETTTKASNNNTMHLRYMKSLRKVFKTVYFKAFDYETVSKVFKMALHF